MYIFDFLIFKFFVWNFVLVCSMRGGTSLIFKFFAWNFVLVRSMRGGTSLIFKFFVWNFVLVCSMRGGTSFISCYAASQFSKHHLLKSHFSLTDFCCLPFSRLRCSVVSESLWPHGQQHARLPCPSPAPGGHSNSCPLSRWCHPTISPSAVPLLLLPSILPSIRVFQWVSSSHQVAKVLELQLPHQSFQWTPRADLL